MAFRCGVAFVAGARFSVGLRFVSEDEDLKYRTADNGNVIAIKDGEVVGGAGASVGPDKIPSFECQGQGGGTAASERNAGRLRAHSHGAEANPRADVVEDASPFYELLEVRVS